MNILGFTQQHILRRKPLTFVVLWMCALLVLAACFGRATDEPSTSKPPPTATEGTAAVSVQPSTNAPKTPTTQEQNSAADSQNVVARNGFDRVAMVRNIINDAILPLHEQFEVEAFTLKEAIRAFNDEPTAATLAAVQNTWRLASDAWAGCQLFSSQEAVLIQNQISKWPTKVEFIEKFVAEEETLNATFVASIGSSSKGLPAIEYLIFDAEFGNDRVLGMMTDGTAGEKRRDYLVGLGDNLYDNAVTARTYWATEPTTDGTYGPIGQLLATAESTGDVKPIMQILMNGVSEQLEDILTLNLRGIVNAELGMPISVEAPYSNYSLSHVAKYVEAFQLTYAGGPDADALGLDDYLDFLEISYNDELMSSHIQTPTPNHKGKPLSEVVYARIDELMDALAQVEEPLPETIVNSPQTVQDAYDAALRLLILVRVDMVNNFGVTLTFNDGD